MAVRQNTGTTHSSTIIEASHNVCYSAQHLEKTFISAKQDTYYRPVLVFSGRTSGKQQGNPGQEYLGYSTETESVSEAAAALSGDANLGIESTKGLRKTMIREQQAGFKASPTQEQKEKKYCLEVRTWVIAVRPWRSPGVSEKCGMQQSLQVG